MTTGRLVQKGILIGCLLLIGMGGFATAGDITWDQCDPTIQNASSTAEDATTWPAPVILSLYPSSIAAGMSTFTLTIDGNYFIPESRVYWDWQDRTLQYHSPYQITARILATDITTPGQHYVIVDNPSPCGGNSNIVIFPVIDDGQTFPLTTNPLNAQIIKGDITNGSFLVSTLPDGLEHFNITIYTEEGAPFTPYITGIPTWITNPEVFWLDENHLQISGSDGNHHISNESTGVTLASLTLFGSQNGTSSLHCVLNEATGDSGSSYGTGYTALPVEVKEILPFPRPAGGSFPLPLDLNSDRLYEDINGNENFDFNDIVVFFNNTGFIKESEPVWAFDFDHNGICNLNDVVSLFQLAVAEN